MSKADDKMLYQAETFAAYVPCATHIPREDGGHIYITSKEKYFCSRLDLSPKEAAEVMRLSMLVSEAMIAGMKNRGVLIERINYQENGNWALRDGKTPYFHIHLYGRTRNAKTQTWGEALVFPNGKNGFYEGFEPFNEEDIEEIEKQIGVLEKTDKYDLKKWNLE